MFLIELIARTLRFFCILYSVWKLFFTNDYSLLSFLGWTIVTLTMDSYYVNDGQKLRQRGTKITSENFKKTVKILKYDKNYVPNMTKITLADTNYDNYYVNDGQKLRQRRTKITFVVANMDKNYVKYVFFDFLVATFRRVL